MTKIKVLHREITGYSGTCLFWVNNFDRVYQGLTIDGQYTIGTRPRFPIFAPRSGWFTTQLILYLTDGPTCGSIDGIWPVWVARASSLAAVRDQSRPRTLFKNMVRTKFTKAAAVAKRKVRSLWRSTSCKQEMKSFSKERSQSLSVPVWMETKTIHSQGFARDPGLHTTSRSPAATGSIEYSFAVPWVFRGRHWWREVAGQSTQTLGFACVSPGTHAARQWLEALHRAAERCRAGERYCPASPWSHSISLHPRDVRQEACWRDWFRAQRMKGNN